MVLALEATGLLRKNAIDQGHQRGNGDLLTKGMLWKYLGERDRDHPELAKGDRFLRERGNAIRAQKSKEVRAKSDFLISNSPSANPRTIARLRRSLSEGRGGKT